MILSPEGCWTDLSRSSILVKMLKCIAFHEGTVSLKEFETELWPDELILPEAANNRIHVALSKLRSKGLDVLIEKKKDGYSFDPKQQFLWLEAT